MLQLLLYQFSHIHFNCKPAEQIVKCHTILEMGKALSFTTYFRIQSPILERATNGGLQKKLYLIYFLPGLYIGSAKMLFTNLKFGMVNQ